MMGDNMMGDAMIKPEAGLIVACEAFKDELAYFQDIIKVKISWIEHSLHDVPVELNTKIKTIIREAEEILDPGSTVLLFFGNCGGALDLIRSETLNIIYPDVHDCIPVLLGSMEKFRRLHAERPGVFYLNKAWIDSGAGPMGCARKYIGIYGEAKGWKAAQKMYRSYTHFMLIDNGCYGVEPYRNHVREACRLFDKEYIEEKGSLDMVEAILTGKFTMKKIPARRQPVLSGEVE